MNLTKIHCGLELLFSPAEEVPQLLQTLGVPEFYLAGGFFRDLLNGREWKDIDVFIPGDEPLEDAEECHRYDLAKVAEFTFNKHLVNVIKLNHAHTFESILERMDIGLCQIGMKGHEVFATQAYLDDVANKTITVLHPPESEQDYDHLKRVQAKYPDFEVVRP